MTVCDRSDQHNETKKPFPRKDKRDDHVRKIHGEEYLQIASLPTFVSALNPASQRLQGTVEPRVSGTSSLALENLNDIGIINTFDDPAFGTAISLTTVPSSSSSSNLTAPSGTSPLPKGSAPPQGSFGGFRESLTEAVPNTPAYERAGLFGAAPIGSQLLGYENWSPDAGEEPVIVQNGAMSGSTSVDLDTLVRALNDEMSVLEGFGFGLFSMI